MLDEQKGHIRARALEGTLIIGCSQSQVQLPASTMRAALMYHTVQEAARGRAAAPAGPSQQVLLQGLCILMPLHCHACSGHTVLLSYSALAVLCCVWVTEGIGDAGGPG